MWHDFGVALCLVLIIEGVLPFLCPGYWRSVAANLVRLNDRSLRIMGLVSMVIGAVVLSLLRG